MQYLTRAQVTLYGHSTLADWSTLPALTDLSATTQVNMQVKVKQNKTEELSFRGNLAHEQNNPFLTQITGQHPNDTEQKNAQHGSRNTHEPPSWMLSSIIPKSGNFQHTYQLNT